jgi:hypothetical protein
LIAIGVDREHALDELYAAAPDEFVRRRTELARELRSSGDKDAASDVERRRRPTTVAYVLNQLARRHPDDVADLVDAGRSLQRAQRRAMRGEASDLRAAIAKQREVVAAVAERAAAMMKELDVDADAHLPDVARALQAALVDAAAGAKLEEGRLDKTLEAESAFPGTEVEPAPAPLAKGDAKSTARDQRRRRMIEDAEAERDDAEAHAREIEARFERANAQALALEQEA